MTNYRVEDYRVWMEEEIWLTDNERGKRKEYIVKFKEDIERWMHGRGYEMDGQWKSKGVVGRWLYCIHVMERVKKERIGGIEYSVPNHRDWPEDRDTYEVYVDMEEVEIFLERWRTNEDFSELTRVGQRVREEMRRFLYIFIDMDNSKRGKEIYRIVMDTDDEDDGDKDDRDIYIVEAQEGYHGGGWQKV